MGRGMLSRALSGRRTNMALLGLLIEVSGEARVADVSHGVLLIHGLVVSGCTRNATTARHVQLGPLLAVVQHKVLALEAALGFNPLAFSQLLTGLVRKR